MSRTITAPELSLLRGQDYRTKLHLGIWKPEIVFAAQVNQTFTTHDAIAEVTFDNVTTGAYTDVVAGMTCWVGSSAGARDLGLVRVRKAATSATLYIAQTSQIDWDDDLHLSVVDDFQPLPKLPYGYTNAIPTYMDLDIAYSDQHDDFDPVPVLGPIITPLMLTGASVDYTPPDAADSWVIGSTIASYSWWVTGGASIVNETTSQPTFTFTSAGQYRIYCEITATNGKTFTGTRPVRVFDENDPPINEFSLQNCDADLGWVFGIEIYESLSDVQDNALAVLFVSDESYGGTKQNIAADSQNPTIVATGWIGEETIVLDAVQGMVTCRVYGPVYWLEKVSTSPAFFTNTSSAPANWSEFQGLTARMALWHVLHWTSTLTAIMDINLPDDTRVAPFFDANGNTLAEQIVNIATRILAVPRSDRYGALWVEIDQNLIPEADRTSLPVSMELESQDWLGQVSIQRVTAKQTSMVDVSGTTSAETTYYSRAMGSVQGALGMIYLRDDLIVSDQNDLDTLAGLLYNQQNNPYPLTRLELSHHQRVIDIAPRQYVQMSIAASDNERGITWASKKLIPRRISLSHDADVGDIPMSMELAGETFEGLAKSYEREQTPIDNFPPLPDLGFGDFPLTPIGSFLDDPAFVPIDPPIDDDDCSTDTSAGANGPFIIDMFGTQYSNDPEGRLAYLPSSIRSSAHANGTTGYLSAIFQTRDASGNWVDDETDDSWYNIYGLQNSGRVATAAKSAISDPNFREFTFSPSTSLPVYGYEISMDADSEMFDRPSAYQSHAEFADTIVTSESLDVYQYASGANILANNTWYITNDLARADTTIYLPINTPTGDDLIVDFRWNILISGVGADVDDWKFSLDDFSAGVGPNYPNQEFSGELLSVSVGKQTGFKIPFNFRWGGAATPFSATILANFVVMPRANHRIIWDNVTMYNLCPRFNE